MNPFDITKAVHYSNEELLQYWVNFPVKGGFNNILKPTSAMPMLIVGGKGSGKTHVMKYFSFDLQKLRAFHDGCNIKDTVVRDKYIGIYMRAGNLNSKKFKGNEHSIKGWQTIFEYYMDLFMSQITISIINEIKDDSNGTLKERVICEEIVKLLDFWPKDVDKPTCFVDLVYCFENFQKELDYEVNNSAITGEKLENVRILCSGGKLILGIPKILSEILPSLKGVIFLYLIDEYENFTHDQQKFVNTLIREVEAPSSFKIGSRLYGIKTFDTYSADEQIREGSEFDVLNLDLIFREQEIEYSKFIKSVCVKRISQLYPQDTQITEESFSSFFERFNEEEFENKINFQKANKHRERFKRKLVKFNIPYAEEIVANTINESSPIIEKTAQMLLLREWKAGSNLLEASKAISQEMNMYQSQQKSDTNSFHTVLSYYKNDIIDQLSRTYNLPIPYVGLDNIIKMSAGIPRLVLITLKHIVRWANFHDESLFSNSIISAKSQSNGMSDAIKWFLADARMPGEDGIIIQQNMQRLGQYLQVLRYSDLPPECSISTFTTDKASLNTQTVKRLEYLEQYSYIIKTGERRDKNTDRLDETYKIIGILAPHWGLSIHSRGAVPIRSSAAEIIFTTEDGTFNNFIKEIKSKYNAPFSKENSSTLFD